MAASNPLRTALVGFLALLVVGELVARLQGDRLCSDRPGVVYERDADLGWRHVPGLSGRVGTCDSEAVPARPIETDAEGFVGPPRAREKPPNTARILLLGGNVPEGFGVPQDASLAQLLEVYADERQGRRVEVLNGATGGWAIDNSLAFFRTHGAARSPDLVVLVLDPVADLASISPAYLLALGRRIPAKPYFSLVDGKPQPMPPFTTTSTPAPPPSGPLAYSALYRLLRGIPARTGEPMAWAEKPDVPHGPPGDEETRSIELARELLRTFRDDVAASGGRLVTVIASLPGATGVEATGKQEREGLIAIAEELGIPVLDLTVAIASVEQQGFHPHLENSVRLSGAGHAVTSAQIWGFLARENLVPAGVVSARSPGGGHAIPDLASLPRVVGEALWESRHGLLGRFIQLGLLAVCVVWISAPLPAGARRWILAAVGAGMLWLLGGPEAAGIGAALIVACYGVVELLPPVPATAVVTVLLGGLVAATARWHAVHVPGDPWDAPLLLAAASNVALLRLVAYAVDRRRGAPRLPLRDMAASMLFFPTLPAGPIESPTVFAARQGEVPPTAAVVAVALGRLVLGWLEFTLAPLFLALNNADVFGTGGAGFSRLRLWVFVGEVAALLTLLLAGWSNVAIALGRLAGVDPPENMRRPWLAPSVAEFWRRWHASLTDWLRAYLYVPLGGARRNLARNVVIVFLAAAGWYVWGVTKLLGYKGFGPRAWKGIVLCALLNAGAVVVVHAIGGRRAADRTPGAVGTAWRVAATAVLVGLAWLPVMLPLWNHLSDLAAVYLRLFFLR